MATIEQRITWSEIRTRAQGLRTRSMKAGEAGLSIRVSDVLEILPLPYDPEPLPDDATTEEIAEAEREPSSDHDGNALELLLLEPAGDRETAPDAESEGQVEAEGVAVVQWPRWSLNPI